MSIVSNANRIVNWDGKPLVMSPTFIKEGDTYYLKDPRKLIVTHGVNLYTGYMEGNTKVSLSDLQVLVNNYKNVYLIGDVGYQSYVPEPITPATITQIQAGGMITSIRNEAEGILVSVNNCDNDMKIVNYDIYGNTIDEKSIGSGECMIGSRPGTNIVTLLKREIVIDSKRIFVK